MTQENTVEAQTKRFVASIEDADERKKTEAAFESDTATRDMRKQLGAFVLDERETAWKAGLDEQRMLMPEFAIPMLANQVKKLEEKLGQIELDNITREEPEVEQVESNTQDVTDLKRIVSTVRGGGYNIEPRVEADGSIELFGRYNGPFYAEPLIKDQQDPATGAPDPRPYSDTLRVYNGVVTAGNSSFFWPTDVGTSFDTVPYRDFKFDHSTLGTSPSAAVGIYVVYIEVAVYPGAEDCSVLWTGSDALRYTPVLRAYKYTRTPAFTNPFPDQKYSFADHTQADDLAYCSSAGGNPHDRINPRGLNGNEDILCAKFILGELTIRTNDSGDRVEIQKWEPNWHASDIYCPVWQWNHCSDADGIQDYPDTDTLECIYGASLCSPTCFTPWDYFTDHYHKPDGGGTWTGSSAGRTSFPYEDDCFLDGTGPADHQEGG